MRISGDVKKSDLMQYDRLMGPAVDGEGGRAGRAAVCEGADGI